MAAVPSGIAEVDSLTLDSASRPLRIRPLEVHEYRPASALPEEQLALPGTITVLVARKGNSLLSQIERSLSGEGNEVPLAKRLYKQYADRKKVSLTEAVEIARKQPVLADLRYGGKELAQNIFVPSGLGVAVITLPYNGGRLARKAFSWVEHARTEATPSLDVLVLRHTPPLTDAERVALNQVPAELREMFIGDGPGPVACSVVIFLVAVVVEVAIVAATWAAAGAHNIEEMAHLSPAEISRIGPNATAQRLTEMRREALQNNRRNA
jgi:hypothetical protein